MLKIITLFIQKSNNILLINTSQYYEVQKIYPKINLNSICLIARVRSFCGYLKYLEEAEAVEKSKEIATNRYPTGELESTFMVVYSYPRVGAMTVMIHKGNSK